MLLIDGNPDFGNKNVFHDLPFCQVQYQDFKPDTIQKYFSTGHVVFVVKNTPAYNELIQLKDTDLITLVRLCISLILQAMSAGTFMFPVGPLKSNRL